MSHYRRGAKLKYEALCAEYFKAPSQTKIYHLYMKISYIMDLISDALQPHKDLIESAASYLTMAQFFSGTFLCRDIYKQGSTKNVDSFPFVVGIMVALAFLKYGIILKDDITLQINFVAITLNILYCIFYYVYSNDKWNELLKPLAAAAAFVAVLWGYCEWESPLELQFRYGLIVTILLFYLLGNPLLGVGDIIKNKDASQIPFVLTLMGTLVTLAWLMYAFVLKNTFMIAQNVVGFMLCFVQLILIFIYPGKPSRPIKKKKQ